VMQALRGAMASCTVNDAVQCTRGTSAQDTGNN